MLAFLNWTAARRPNTLKTLFSTGDNSNNQTIQSFEIIFQKLDFTRNNKNQKQSIILPVDTITSLLSPNNQIPNLRLGVQYSNKIQSLISDGFECSTLTI